MLFNKDANKNTAAGKSSGTTAARPAAANRPAGTTTTARPAATNRPVGTTTARPAAANRPAAVNTTARPAAVNRPAANTTARPASANRTAANPAAAVNRMVNSAQNNKIGKTISSVANSISDRVEDLSDDVKNAFSGLAKSADAVKNGANTRNEMFKKVCALIPNKINNETVVNALDVLRKQQKLLKKDFSANLKKNQLSLKNHLDLAKTKTNDYIEDQNAYTDVAYGDATMQFSGCEIFATYNAIRNIAGKATANLAQMISEYEADGMVLSGKFGTAPKAIRDYLEKKGYTTEMSTEESEFDAIGRKHQSTILTMYNDKNDISKEVHTVNISKTNGKFSAHNVYCNGKVVGPYSSISEVIKNINNGMAKGISLIGISKK